MIEKERLTPENYPLSLRALTQACNQSTSRDPIVHYDEKTVEAHLFELRRQKLASLVMTAGARVQKFRHHLDDHFELDAREVALLCVLLLRGPQTIGELRTRTERLHPFQSVPEVEESLRGLIEDENPLVRIIAAQPGQKEKRYVQVLSGPFDSTIDSSPNAPPAHEPPPSKTELLQAEVEELKSAFANLREDFEAFKKQFE